MDVSELRQQYRQRRSREVLLFTRTDRMSDAVSVVPVAQGSTSPWQPNSPAPPVCSFGSNPKMFDPWHVHLDLHRRARLLVQPPPSSPDTQTSRCSEVFSSSLQGGPSPSGSPCSSRDTSSSDPLRADPGSESSDGSTPGSSEGCREDQGPCSSEDPHHRRSTEGSESEPTSPQQNQSAETSRSGHILNHRVRRQLSTGGLDPSSQNHYPFPSRKTPKISKAARRLGLYSSF